MAEPIVNGFDCDMKVLVLRSLLFLILASLGPICGLTIKHLAGPDLSPCVLANRNLDWRQQGNALIDGSGLRIRC
jgi:hypothetical protein